MTADEGLTALIPHQHGGTDAPECTPFGIPCRPSTPADDGLPAAVARVEAAYLAHRWNASTGCQCGWEGDFEPWARHQSEIVARAAREGVVDAGSVAETVREAEVEAWDEGFEAATEHASAYTHGNNGPPDPPRNPFLRAGEA